MKNIAGILCIVSTLISCGKSDSNNNSVRAGNYGLTPIQLTQEYESCPLVFAQSENTDFSIPLFFENRLTKKTFNFSTMLEGPILRSKDKSTILATIVANDTDTTYYFEYDYLTSSYDYVAEKSFITKNSEARYSTICKGIKEFSRYTYESASLATNYSIQSAYNAVKLVMPSANLAAVYLDIAPIKGTQTIFNEGPKGGLASELSYETDNAYYRPGSNMITFLPQSIEYKTRTNGEAPLWEVPMVGAHEYGHHIFYELFAKFEKDNASEIQAKNCITHNEHHKHSLSLNAKRVGDSRKANSDFAKKSLNEGFADLISYYSLPSNLSGLQGIRCMEIERDISSNRWGNGQLKRLSKNALHSMDNSTIEERPKSCKIPWFQDSHIVGAVFANYADQLLSQFTESKQEKLKVTLKWLESLKVENKKISESNVQSASGYTIEAFKLFYKVSLDHFNRQETEEDCDFIKKFIGPLSTDFGPTNYMSCN